MRYAMAANFQHLDAGSKPTKGDQAKAILKMCETMNFGFDSKSVIPQLRDWGIKCHDTHIRKVTADLRKEIDAKRDHEIVVLNKEGMTQRQIAERVGCIHTTVSRVLASIVGAKRDCLVLHQAKEESTSSPDEGSSPFDNDKESLALEDIGFDEEDEDIVPIINPAEAFNKVLKETDAKAQDGISAPNVVTNEDAINTVAGDACFLVLPYDGQVKLRGRQVTKCH